MKIDDFQVLIGNFYPAPGDVQIVRMLKPGASGPQIMIIKVNGTGQELALKFGASRVSIAEQVKNYQTLASYFGSRLAKIFSSRTNLAGFDAAMIMEAYDTNFHDLVVSSEWSDQECEEMWKSVLYEITSLWRKTCQPLGSLLELRRNPIQRIERVSEFLYRYRLPSLEAELGSYGGTIVVNGEEYASLIGLFDLIGRSYRPPSIKVMCHGDLNADNILVKGRNWAMGDFEWCGHHDWCLSMSHLIGWWISNAASQRIQPKSSIKDGRLHLDFDAELRPLIKEMAASAYTHGLEFAQEVGDTRDIPSVLDSLLATLLLGDLRFLESRGKDTATAIYLLGMAVEIAVDGFID